jgi:4-carboxymuconolactone decarboxylase
MADPSLETVLTLVRISACVALRNESDLRAEFVKAIDSGIELTVIREAVLQCYLFAGYAAAINAFILLNELTDSEEFFQEESGSLEQWKVRGEQLCRKIYGSQYEKLVHNMTRLHPDLSDWMLWEGYGKVLSRPFLSPIVRELLIVGMTAVLQVERQFYSHVRGALNVGATADQVRGVFAEVRHHLADEGTKYEKIINEIVGA